MGGLKWTARCVPAACGAGASVLALCGCTTTAQRSGELERSAKHEALATRGVSVSRESPSVKVLDSAVIHSSEGAAVVVSVRNTSSHVLEDAPIAITVRDAHGTVLFRNDAPGLDNSLTHISLLLPGRQTLWVDDQVPVSGLPASVNALVGEGRQASGGVPELSISGTHQISEAGVGAGVAGTVTNRSSSGQQHLVVYAIARNGARIVAAGRAVLQEVPSGASMPFQIYFTGNPHGAGIQTSAPATTF